MACIIHPFACCFTGFYTTTSVVSIKLPFLFNEALIDAGLFAMGHKHKA